MICKTKQGSLITKSKSMMQTKVNRTHLFYVEAKHYDLHQRLMGHVPIKAPNQYVAVKNFKQTG